MRSTISVPPERYGGENAADAGFAVGAVEAALSENAVFGRFGFVLCGPLLAEGF